MLIKTLQAINKYLQLHKMCGVCKNTPIHTHNNISLRVQWKKAFIGMFFVKMLHNILFLEYNGAHNIGNAKYNKKNCI